MVAVAADDPGRLEAMVARRRAGEPLAWITGSILFSDVRLTVRPGVYVPRVQSEIVVRAAVEVLPPGGLVVDLCTGSGAVAAAIARLRPESTVLASEVDPVACRCARDNGVTVFQGDLDAALPAGLPGGVDVVTAVAPYVPSDQIRFLPRDFRDREPRRAVDGGPDGLAVVRRVLSAAASLLHPGGALVMELGADQDRRLQSDLRATGFGGAVEPFYDDDGDLRAIRARQGSPGG